MKLVGLLTSTAKLSDMLKGPTAADIQQSRSQSWLLQGYMFRLNLFSCCELAIHYTNPLINLWRYDIVVIPIACGVCSLPLPDSATMVHTGVCPDVASATYVYRFARLTLYRVHGACVGICHGCSASACSGRLDQNWIHCKRNCGTYPSGFVTLYVG